MASANVVQLSNSNFKQSISKGVAVVDFWATWCGPCRMLGPIIDQLADEYEGKAVVAKVNVDEENELASQFGVMSIPTVLFFKNGELQETSVGLKSKADLATKINALL